MLNDYQRFRLAHKAKLLTREMLDYTAALFTPATVLGWYRKLIAHKYTSPANNPRRPRIDIEIIELVLKLRNENPKWGSKNITDVIISLDYDVSRTTVRNILIQNGYYPESDRNSTWKDFLKTGRVHQSLGEIIEPQHQGNTGEIFCIERLGGLLKSYHRKAPDLAVIYVNNHIFSICTRTSQIWPISLFNDSFSLT